MTQGMLRTFRHGQFSAATLAGAKDGRTVSLCLPARDEAGTVGPIVARTRTALVERTGLVDEILVLDDHSADDTAAVARAAGARVVAAADVLSSHGAGHGKGEALWKSLHAAEGDLIVWCDADVVDFEPHFVVGLLGPLLSDRSVEFVKGCYERPGSDGGTGGRVTELVARPLLALLFPELAAIRQPLAGEYAGRRELLEQVPFVEGYGVDLGLLIDIAERFGPGVLAEVDLGVRVHRNRPLGELAPQAAEILRMVLQRAGRRRGAAGDHAVGPGGIPPARHVPQRPPLVTVAGYRRRSA